METARLKTPSKEVRSSLPLLSVNSVDQLVYVNNRPKISFADQAKNASWEIFKTLSAKPNTGVPDTTLQKRLTHLDPDVSLVEVIDNLNHILNPINPKNPLITTQKLNEQITEYTLNARVIVVKI